MAAQDMSGILLVGDKEVGKFSLIAALQPGTSSKCHLNGYELALDTKYYTARVGLQVKGAAERLASASVDTFDAVVLVFDASRQGSFEAVQRWAGRHDTSQAEIRLLVATKVDLLMGEGMSSPVRPAWLEDAMGWSCEQLFEYIEVSATEPAVDAKLALDGDRQGVARVAAAISAHMWPGLVQKPPSRLASTPSLQHAEPLAAASEHAEPLAAYAPESGDSNVRDQGSSASRQDAASSTCSSHDTARAGTTATPTATAAQSPQQQRAEGIRKSRRHKGDDDIGDSELEADAAKFEYLLRDMQGARERFATLPDKQRRAAAAELAMQFARMLGDDSDIESNGSDIDDQDDDVALPADTRPAVLS